MSLEANAVALLQQLIRHNTVNPPGNERPLQEGLAGQLRDAGFEVSLLGRTEERPNLVARLRGRADGPVLGLLSHCDTVLADPREWQHDPWSGDLIDGEVWGRGAQDMKSQTAAEVAAALELARSGWRPARGDLLVLVVADEETGGGDGAVWLCEHHPEAVRCDLLLNEGAGTRIDHDGQRVYGICAAEKGVFRFTVRTRGTASHASMPNVSDNALLKLAPFVTRLGDARVEQDVTESPQRLLEILGTDLDSLRRDNPLLAAFVEPMLGVTFAPTRISASEKINVIPAIAELMVDCRVPPGLGRETAERRIREAIGDGGDFELQFDEEVVGNSSPIDTPLFEAIEGWVQREEPEARVVPVMLPAFTDSRTFRDTFPECVAYGWFPQREKSLFEMWPLVHGKDERIDAADVGWAARGFYDVTKEMLGG